jgi:O-methyltransferase
MRENIPGCFIETGVWRDGAGIFMRAMLAAYGDKSRVVWVTDSFACLPPPSGDMYESTCCPSMILGPTGADRLT